MSDLGTALPASELIARVGAAVQRIQSLLQRVLAELPGSESRVRPLMLANRLKLNKSLTSRLLIALEMDDALATAQALPGPVPLRSFLDAAQAHGVPPGTIVEARLAIDDFDKFLDEHFEERGELDILLGSSLFEARVKAESAAKQAAFRGYVGLTGVMCEATLSAYMVHPSAGSDRLCDVALLGGMMGLRRLRPDVEVEHTVRRVASPADAHQETDPRGALVRSMCRPADIPIATSWTGEQMVYRLLGDGIGRRSAVNCVVGVFWPRAVTRMAEPGGPQQRAFGATIADQPAKRLVLDVFVHQSLWVDRAPEVMVYNLACHGPIVAGDPMHAKRRLALAESVRTVGVGSSCARHADLPGYVDAINETAAAHGWTAKEFRLHRCEVMYPPFGSQVSVVFPLDAADAGVAAPGK